MGQPANKKKPMSIEGGAARGIPEDIQKKSKETDEKIAAFNKERNRKAQKTGDEVIELGEEDMLEVEDINEADRKAAEEDAKRGEILSKLSEPSKKRAEYMDRMESLADEKDEERGRILGKLAEQTGPAEIESMSDQPDIERLDFWRKKAEEAGSAEAEDVNLNPETEQEKLARQKKEGLIAGKEAFDRKQAQAERDRQAMDEMAARHENRAESGKTKTVREAQEAGDFIANAAMNNDLAGRSEAQEMMTAEYLGNERAEAAAFLDSSFGIKSADAYAEKLATSRWAQVKHAARMLQPSFKRAWNAFAETDRAYQQAVKDENFPDVMSTKVRAKGARSNNESTFVGNKRIG